MSNSEDLQPIGTSPTMEHTPEQSDEQLTHSLGDGGLAAELIRQRLRARMFGLSPTGTKVGRFILLDQVGSGGMGQVYAAWDEQLARRVALKLLLRHDDAARVRVLREAQAQARVAHPNVVPIYDTGVDEGRLWLAMEYIEGQTLRAWLAEEAPSWRKLLVLLVQAGRGLEAAHRVGLVHRDFKPNNVMVGPDGRARVLDFGLARGISELSASSSGTDSISATWATLLTESASGTQRSMLDRSVTAQGSLLGTPAYMAPEQYLGRRGDELSDQYAFCVSAFECLYGLRPFSGRNLAELSDAVIEGRRAAIPSDTKVPRRVGAIISRGLSLDPHERWPNLGELLSALEDALAPSRSRMFLAGALSLAVFASIVGVAVAGSDANSCAIDASALAIDATSQTSAPIAVRLDAWRARWREAAQHNCEATRSAQTQSEQLFEQRGTCLEQQRQAFLLVAQRLHDEPSARASAPRLLANLPDPQLCASAHVQEAGLPSDPAQRAELLEAFATLARADSLLLTRELGDAERLLEQVAQSPAIEHLPLALQLERQRASLEGSREDFGALVARLGDAIDRSAAAKLYTHEALLRLELVKFAGDWSVPEARELLIEEAERALTRAGLDSEQHQLSLHLARASSSLGSGRYAEASTHYETSLELAERLGHDQSRVEALVGLGIVAQHREAFARGREAYARALDIAQRWGPDNAMLELIAFNHGLLELDAGEPERARAQLEHARRIRSLLWGPDSIAVARVDFALAGLAADAGEIEQGRALCESLLPIYERELPPDHIDLGQLHNALGVFAFYAGHYAASLDHYRRALAIAEHVHGPRHDEVALLHSNIGESLLELGQGAEAAASFSAALAIYTSLPDYDANHNDIAFVLHGQGLALLAAGDASAAVLAFERAVAIHERYERQPIELARARFALARALPPAARARARALAEQARASFEAPEFSEQREQITNWLATH